MTSYANKEQRAAHMSVNYAIKKGKLQPPGDHNCKHCGKPATMYHHHKGYDKKFQLDVVPLCRSCHSIEHKGNNGKVKLSDENVKTARSLYNKGARISDIAKQFNYDPSGMRDIVRGKSYKWVK